MTLTSDTTGWQQPADLRWDPLDETLKDDPHPIWRRMREEAPLYRNDEYDFWALTRFADVDAAHRDPATFSSAHGTVLEMMTAEPLGLGLMIFMDPPDHTRLRRLVSRAFSPRRVTELESTVRQIASGLLDAAAGTGRFDYVADFGAKLPATVIATILGVPPSEREEVRRVIDQMFHIEPGVGMVNDASIQAGAELWNRIAAQVAERRAHPRDDMLGDIVESEIVDDDGQTRRLTDEECTAFGILLVSAGTETVARLIGWAGLLLDRHPDQRADLAADPELVPNAIEEILRYEAPSPVQGRWTTKDVELYGRTVPAGSKVLLVTAAADRDDRVFPDADRFDIRRRFGQHVAFGYGIHFCIGASLARMEARVALEETLRRYPTWEVDHAGAVPLHTSTVRGYAKLPITV